MILACFRGLLKKKNLKKKNSEKTLSKVLEKAVHGQLMDYLENNNLLTDRQYGYRRKTEERDQSTWLQRYFSTVSR